MEPEDIDEAKDLACGLRVMAKILNKQLESMGISLHVEEVREGMKFVDGCYVCRIASAIDRR